MAFDATAKRKCSNHSLDALGLTREQVLADFKLGHLSRQASLIGRKEVLTGKAKFGIFGDGKEVPQLALAHSFHKGDWRSGYYRDQTIMFATGAADVKQFFSQLYADTDPEREPHSRGRQMNNHFATPFIGPDGQWLSQTSRINSAADLSPTGGQMARLVGLAYASKLYRQNKDLSKLKDFSTNGDEVAFGTIGNASCAEGLFWETLNAAGVLQIPLVISVWDDDYGISVPNSFQITKDSISEVLAGFPSKDGKSGVDLYVVKGWDYPALVDTYRRAVAKTRKEHVPCLIHVIEVTQPQGHSTSGSHERYKSKERLEFESHADALLKMREWMEDQKIATAKELDAIEQAAKQEAEILRQEAWDEYLAPISGERDQAVEILGRLAGEVSTPEVAKAAALELQKAPSLFRRGVQSALKRVLYRTEGEASSVREELEAFVASYERINKDRYTSHLLNETRRSPLHVQEVPKVYGTNPEMVDGRQIIQKFFDKKFAQDPRLFVIGEDVGKIGGVNAEFEGMQEKYGALRVTDTGIREATILGQGMGAAMRGLRPVIEVQYLDYLLYCLQGMSDDLASLHYRSGGIQSCPLIVLTRGHRLEGIWHTGSPMGMVVHALRGMHICVPRNMTQAAGMYNTLLQGDDPGLVVEVLNGYRVKEALPENLGNYTVPLGVPEILREGTDVTLVTYGACVRVADEACRLLEEVGISVELIDVQTLLPFDRQHVIRRSIEKTNAVVFLDEDVPGGASAYMMQQVMEGQDCFDLLDKAPRTLSAVANRAAYASDGDYYCKPNAEDIFDLIRRM